MKSEKKRLNIFFPFRAFHNQALDKWVIIALLLPFVFNALTVYFLPQITDCWAILMHFFLLKIGYSDVLTYTEYTLFKVSFLLPSIDLDASAPSALCWYFTLLLVIIIFLLTYLITEAFTPLKYLVRAVLFVLSCSLLFFYFYPADFPYDVEIYTRVGMMQILSMIILIPWIFAFSYYLFGYKIVQKSIVTTFVILYFVLLGPFQYLISAIMINQFSLLYMATLYIFFGLLIDIFILIAFYGYALSIQSSLSKYSLD